MNSSPKLYSLQYLRGIAASLVVLFHFFVETERYYNRFGITSNTFADHYQKYQDILAVGVDIFFVVSGVVMVISTEKLRPKGKVLFLFRRVLRIIPLYWVLTIGYAILIMLASEHFSEAEVDSAHLIKSLLLIPATAPNGQTFPLLFQGWTLTYEIIFYVFFSLTLFIPYRKSALAICGLLLILWHLLFYTSFSNSILISRTTDNIILEFIFGLLIGYFWQNSRLPAKLAVFTTILSILGFLLALNFANSSPSVPRALLWGLPSALLVTAFLMFESKHQTPNTKHQNRTLLFLGKISYSIYLAHDIALSAFLFFIAKLGALQLTPVWLLAVLSFPFSIFCSTVVYLLLEKPLMSYFYKWRLH